MESVLTFHHVYVSAGSMLKRFDLFGFSDSHPVLIILIISLITIFLGYFALQVELDSNIQNLVPEDEQVTALLKEHGFEEGTYRMLILAIEAEDRSLYDLEGLQLFEKVIEQVAALEGITESISPFSTISFRREGTRLAVSTPGPEGRAPKDQAELNAFKLAIAADPTLEGIVRSPDSSILAACFYCGPSDDTREFMKQFSSTIEPLKEYYQVYASGDYVFTALTESYMSKDLSVLLILSSLCILLFFYLGFRSPRAVLLPFVSVLIGTVWSLGLMAIFSIKLTIIGIMMPPLVITLGTSYSIHLLNEYYRSLPSGSFEQKWILAGVRRISSTILVAAFTTAAGFLSLLATSLQQSREFGLSSVFGIASSCLLALFFLPAVLKLLDPPEQRFAEAVRGGKLTLFMGRLAVVVHRWRYGILCLFGLCILGFALAGPRMTHQSDYLNYFPRSEPIVQDLVYLTEQLGSFQPVNITLKAPEGTKDYFLRPDVLESVVACEEGLRKLEAVQRIRSFPQYLCSMNTIMTGEQGLPEQRGLLMVTSRLFRVFDQSTTDAMARCFIDQDYSQITLNLLVRNPETGLLVNDQAFSELYEQIGRITSEHLPEEVETQIWCNALVYLNLSRVMNTDQLLSVILSLLAIFFTSLLILKDLRYSLLILVPLLFGLMVNTIFMVLFSIPRDMISLMVSSVAIGVGVDDAIHFMLQYRQQREVHLDVRRALYATLRVTGRPILLTTISILAGMLVLTAASFGGIAIFGLLVSVTLLSTMVGTLVFLPACLSVVDRHTRSLRVPAHR